MTFTYAPGTDDISLVRLLCTDTDVDHPIFSDEEIGAFLTLEGDPRYAAAMALDTIGSSQALTLKVIELLDLKTDGAKVAASLHAQAESLRKISDGDASFDIAELVVDPFSARERRWKQWERNGGGL